MASTDRQVVSDRDSYPEKSRTGAEALDERRRAALAEIDSAPFSSVLFFLLLRPSSHSLSDGSTSRSVSWPVLVSSPMRMSYLPRRVPT